MDKDPYAILGVKREATQDQIRARGHAIEARITAERADLAFQPATGELSVVDVPRGIRFDSGVEAGSRVSLYYDSMLAKMIANGLVILVAAMLSLQFVVHWWIGSPINGSLLVFLLGAAIYALVVAALGIMLGTLATTMGQFGLLAMPVLIVTQLLSGSATPMESMPVWLQYLVKTISPTPHFVSFAQAVLFRGADLTLLWQELAAMLAIGVVYFTVASIRFRKVIFGG